MSQLEIIENVDEQIIKIRTKSLDISFNELYDMYSEDELKISPNYQRLFRWNEEKQSRFIESLILEMPVPPIFVIEIEDGQYELIDGLQRISSYLHFRGAKFDNMPTVSSEKLSLTGCDIVPSLNGLTFEELPKPLQIKLKRSFVRMEVIKKESEPSLKYHMFKRLNDGGENLSDQEIRNCTIRLLGSQAIDFISECATDSNFKNTIEKIKDSEINKKYDEEIILRFFALKNNLSEYKYPFGEYLTSFLEDITKGDRQFDYLREKEVFKQTFEIINESLGEDAFSSMLDNGEYKKDFVIYYYDAITIAISRLVEEITNEHYSLIGEKIAYIKNDNDIKQYKTGTLSNIKSRISCIEKGVKEVIGLN